MQFAIIAYDASDAEALNRRLAARTAHLEMGDRYKAKDQLLMAAALLNDAEQMMGSVMIVDFPSHAELDAWLKEEPYVTGKVWEKIQVIPCRVGPSFQPKK